MICVQWKKLLVKASKTEVTPPKEEVKPVVSKTGKVTASALNIRSGASTKDKVVGSAKKGDTLSVLSVSGKWAKVSFGKATGYVHTDYLKIETTPPTTPTTAKTHTVQKNDTLYSLSKKYNVSVATLKSLNGLKNDTIQVGKKLIIKK